MGRGRTPSDKPKKREGYVDITTRIPAGMLNYLHLLGVQMNLSLTDMYDVMLQNWYQKLPHERGFPWKETMALSKRTVIVDAIKKRDGSIEERPRTETIATGWVQVNLRVKEAWKLKVYSTATQRGITPSSVLYTMIYWWTWFQHPPKDVAERRKREREIWLAEQRRKMAEAETEAAGADSVTDALIDRVKRGVIP